MSRKRLLKVAMTLLLMLSLAGCGGDDGNSNTNGSLTLAADATITGVGTAVLNATATVVPATQAGGVTPGLAGAEVKFTATQYGPKSDTGEYPVLDTYKDTAYTNNVGVATMAAHSFEQSRDFATTIQVTAECRGLNTRTINIAVAKF